MIVRVETSGSEGARLLPWSGGPARPEVGLDIPLNLGERMPLPVLATWIRQAVEHLDWSHPLVVDYLRSHPEYRPRTLLSLLVFAYSTQVFNSQDIVARCHSDRDFASICGNYVPFVDELVRFRRKNRPLLIKVLADIMVRFLHDQPGWSTRTLPAPETVTELASSRVDIARHMDMCD